VTHRLFAGDGCHRLALLLGAGQAELLPSQYRVRRYLALVPADTTGPLLSRTGATWPDYRSFIALGYPGGTSDPEVEAVMAIDRPHLPVVA
jgi:hypothetical protein